MNAQYAKRGIWGTDFNAQTKNNTGHSHPLDYIKAVTVTEVEDAQRLYVQELSGKEMKEINH
jgi:hypothetical protein